MKGGGQEPRASFSTEKHTEISSCHISPDTIDPDIQMVEEQRLYKTKWEARLETTSKNSPTRSFGAENIKSWFSFSKPRRLMFAEVLCQGKWCYVAGSLGGWMFFALTLYCCLFNVFLGKRPVLVGGD